MKIYTQRIFISLLMTALIAISVPAVQYPPANLGRRGVKPKILSFRAIPRNTRRGTFVRFYWRTRNARVVRLLINGRGLIRNGRNVNYQLTMRGRYQRRVLRRTTFQLVVTNRNGRVYSRIITVKPKRKNYRDRKEQKKGKHYLNTNEISE